MLIGFIVPLMNVAACSRSGLPNYPSVPCMVEKFAKKISDKIMEIVWIKAVLVFLNTDGIFERVSSWHTY